MPIVTEKEAHERLTHYFHFVLKSLPKGHSVVWESCWMCQKAAYAVVTLSDKQQVSEEASV